jgi:hypothetical protein
MSQTQQYLANALDCARRGDASSDAGERRDLERAEQAWLVLAGIEAAPPVAAPKTAPLAAPSPIRADRQGYRPGWYVG